MKADDDYIESLRQDEYYEQFDDLRTAVGYIYYGDDFAPGHDYDAGEKLLRRFMDLIIAKMPLADDVILRQDGNRWMCIHGDFINLQESPSWWGDTPIEAMRNYEADNEREDSRI